MANDEFFSGVDNAVETLNLSQTGAKLDELLRLSKALISALDVEQALVAAGEAVRQVCDAERFVVLLNIDGVLTTRAARDAHGVDLPLPAIVAREVCDAASLSGDVVFAYLPAGTARWRELASVQNLIGVAAVPMVSAHGITGVIYVDGKSQFGRALEPTAKEMLLLLAGHAAMAVINTQLLAKLKTQPAAALPARPYFELRLNDELQRAARYQRPFSVVYIDIVGADDLIARYDLQVLDELIVAVARAVQETSRSTDLLARIGPARIGLLVPEPADGLGEVSGLKGFADRLRQHLSETPTQVRGVPQKVRVLLGGVSYQQAPIFGLKGVLHEADLAVDVAARDRADYFTAR